MGKYSALRFCIVPPFGRANIATLELNISSYCPPCSAINAEHDLAQEKQPLDVLDLEDLTLKYAFAFISFADWIRIRIFSETI